MVVRKFNLSTKNTPVGGQLGGEFVRSRALGEGEPRAGECRHFARNSSWPGMKSRTPTLSLIHLTVPKSARLRREKPKSVILHREDMTSREITVQEGLPLTTIAKTRTFWRPAARIDLLRQAISDARNEGYIGGTEAGQLPRRTELHLKLLRSSGSKLEPTTT